MRHPKFHVLALLAALLPWRGEAADIAVADATQFEAAVQRCQPGDVVILQDGSWKDVNLLFKGKGTAASPVTLRAATPGKVEISGNSQLRIAGEHLHVEGLWFRNATPAVGDVITFREDSKTSAKNCRVTQCAITQEAGTGDAKDRKWVSIYGQQNQVEHCHFSGKTGKGTLLVVWLEQGIDAGHLIEANYFGERLRLGKNGGEIIRVGDSESSMSNARCKVVGNLFERCNGEVEVISNKSCENLYEGNVFRECQGTLTLRHGNRCKVVGNTFYGNGVALTGGIRIIGEDHEVSRNYLEKLEGTEARAALCVMNGIENSPANGYFQVKRALVQGNFISGCRESINIGYADKDVKAPLEPVECVFTGNVIAANPSGKIVILSGSGAGVQWKDGSSTRAELGIAGTVNTVSADEVTHTVYLKTIQKNPLDEGSVGAAWLKR